MSTSALQIQPQILIILWFTCHPSLCIIYTYNTVGSKPYVYILLHNNMDVWNTMVTRGTNKYIPL